MTVPANISHWRSFLFVPANNATIIEKAAERGADVLIVDLEDSIPPEGKTAARDGLKDVTAFLANQGARIIIRVNHDDELLAEDLRAACAPSVSAIMVPMVTGCGIVKKMAGLLAELENERGLEAGSVSILPLIESPQALFRLEEIAAAPRVAALALGSEDFSLALGVPPSPACLTLPCQLVALAAAAHGIPAVGLPSSLAEFRDTETLRASALAARAMGMKGGLCIHPAQVGVCNDVFSPAKTEIDWASALLSAWEKDDAARQKGVMNFGGKMVDKPVVDRARAVLALADSIQGGKA